MRCTIHLVQWSRSEGRFMKRSSVEVPQISEINENTLDNLNNFVSLCWIGIVFIWHGALSVVYNSFHTIISLRWLLNEAFVC